MRDHFRVVGRLALGAAMGLPALALLVVVVVSVPTVVVGGAGLVLFAAATWLIRRLTGLQRRRLGVPVPYRSLPEGLPARFKAVLRDPATGRDLAWLAGQFVAGGAGFVVSVTLWIGALECLTAPALYALVPRRLGFDPAVIEWTGRSLVWSWGLMPVGVAGLFAAARVSPLLLRGQTWLARTLLGPTSTAVLHDRVDRLTATRAATVDASAAELRRIERDLHDGAQARLVAVTMSLGVAEDVIDDDPAGAKALLVEARAGAGAALTELRDLVRGVHPPVLADRGLAAAVEALVLDTSLPADLDLRLTRRLPAPVEAAGYFAIAEALTNAVRHSGASRVRVRIDDLGATLLLSVRDDGHGGADVARGSGLRGIQRRLSAFDGRLCIDSPPGGPTVVQRRRVVIGGAVGTSESSGPPPPARRRWAAASQAVRSAPQRGVGRHPDHWIPWGVWNLCLSPPGEPGGSAGRRCPCSSSWRPWPLRSAGRARPARPPPT